MNIKDILDALENGELCIDEAEKALMKENKFKSEKPAIAHSSKRE